MQTNETSQPAPHLRLCPATAAERPSIRRPQDVAALLPELRDAEQEHIYVLGLDVKNRVAYAQCVALGTVDRCQVALRDVYREAVRRNVGSLILVHNHPSGSCEPSQHDDRLTRSVAVAGKLLGIELLDHVIVGEATVYSYQEARRLPDFHGSAYVADEVSRLTDGSVLF